MDAGRELDALVALNVMGWKRTSDRPDSVRCPYKPDTDWWITPEGEALCVHCTEEPHPAYSTDIKAAWQVVEKLSPTQPFELTDIGSFNPGIDVGDWRWQAAFGHESESVDCAATAPLAISIAALRAVGAEVPA